MGWGAENRFYVCCIFFFFLYTFSIFLISSIGTLMCLGLISTSALLDIDVASSLSYFAAMT